MATGGKRKVGYSLATVGTLTLEDTDKLPWYPSIVVCQDKIVVIDSHEDKVRLFRLHDGKLLAAIERLESVPRDLCLMDAMTICVLHGDGLLKMVSIDSTYMSRVLQTTWSLRLRGVMDYYRGLFRFKDNIVVSGVKQGTMYWCIVALDYGRVDTVHQICKGDGRCRVTTKDNIIYISCDAGDKSRDNTGVYGFDILNPSKFKYKYKHGRLQHPRSIVINEDGNIFVCNGFHDPCIHQLTASCQLVAIFTQGIPCDPFAMFWDNGRLYVACDRISDIAVFQPVYQEGLIRRLMRSLRLGRSQKKLPIKHSQGSAIPVEIIRMDDKSLKLYKEALQDGKEKVYNIRVMVVGQYGVGKTTLTKRLLGQQIDISERKSTEGIDVYTHCCKIALDTGEWIVQHEDSEELFRLQRLVKLLTHQTERPEASNEQRGQTEVIYQKKTIEDLNDPVHYIDSDDEDTSASISGYYMEQEADNTKSSSFKFDLRPSAKDSSGVNIQEGGRLVTSKDDAKMEFLQLVVEKADKLEKSLAEYAELAMWDFAGQYVFYTTHQTFLTCRAIYLLVTDLSKQFTDLVEDDECYFDTEGVKLCKVQDLVEVWLNSVHCCAQSYSTGADSKHDNAVKSPADNALLTSHGSSTPVPSLDVGIPMTPPVILVGTHMDKIQQDKRKEVVSKYFHQICRILKDKPSLQHLVDFLAIDNTQIDPQLETLKKQILQLASGQPYWGEELPANWLPLEEVLMKLKTSGTKVIRHNLLEQLNEAGAVPIKTKEQLDLFLRFQHETGNILYFSVESLREWIVLDPRWLIDALKSLITAETFVLSNYPAVRNMWFEFKENGKLTSQLIDAIWTKQKHPEFYQNKEIILQIMEKLNIVARPRLYNLDTEEVKVEGYFLAPCMLRQATPKDLISLGPDSQQRNTSVICFVFTGKFLPTPVFHRLLAACVAQWPIAKQNMDNLIFCGCCLFDLDLHHRLTLLFRDHGIFARVRIIGTIENTPSYKLCIEVREFLTRTLCSIIGCLGQSLQFEMSIQCPQSDRYSVDYQIPVAILKGNLDVPCHFHDKSHVIVSHDVLKFWFQEEEQSGDCNASWMYQKQGEQMETVASCSGCMKAEIDHTEAVFVHRQLGELAKSVGIIKTECTSGTGFRVGPNYVMTARHVVEASMMKCLHKHHEQHNEYQLNNTNVHIDFSFERNSVPSNMNLVFEFEPEIVYENANLDTVILQLKRCTKEYPPPLTNFTDPRQDRSQGCYFIGHSGGKIKKTDKYNVVNLTPHDVAAAKNWSMSYVNFDGYVGIDDRHRILFHCSFDEGASGAPGFWINPSDGQAYVELMLLRGYPSWYYDEKYKDKITRIPKSNLIEQGVSLKSVYEDMMGRSAFHQSLCQIIFRSNR